MRKTVSQTIRGFVLTATLALAITSCEKDQSIDLSQAPRESESISADAQPEPLSCISTIPAILEVPAGNKFLFKTYATGVQVYQVKRNAINPSVIEWAFIAPIADLFANPTHSNQVGTHFSGPTWAFTKGPNMNEMVVASKLFDATPDATAIPWLLLKAVESKSSAGNRITYIQRICTTGGKAPTTPVSEELLGLVQTVPYTATYVFYEKE